jgi:hypothetical protein
MAAALRHELRNIWRLPDERRFGYTGPDWLLHLLATVDKDARDKTMLLLWCAWHHRNNIKHGNGRVTARESVEFLKSYAAVMEGGPSSSDTGTSRKGKEKVWEGVGAIEVQSPSEERRECCNGWVPPKPGWVKANVNAGFCQNSELASIGVVILSSWRFLEHVATAEEAEALACLEGTRLAVNWVRQPTVVESDCLSHNPGTGPEYGKLGRNHQRD